MTEEQDPLVEEFRTGAKKPCSYCWGGSKKIVAPYNDTGLPPLCPVCNGTFVEPPTPNESEVKT